MKNKIGLTRVSKVFIVMQLMIILVSIVFFYKFTPRIVNSNDFERYTGNVVNIQVENSDFIIIDDDIAFSNPEKYEVVEDNINLRLEPGKYYFKAIGLIESDVKSFEVVSNVDILINKDEETLVNKGNVKVNVSKIDYEKGIVGEVIIDIEEEENINLSDKLNYKGSEA